MAVYTGSRRIPGNVYPVNAGETPWGRLEPLITPELLVQRQLFGIPLVSKHKDPLTGKPYVITKEILTDYINVAVNEAELETGLTIMPVQYEQKMPYNRLDFEALGYFRLPHRPISSIELLEVRASDDSTVFIIPQQWIETGQLLYGQLNLIPISQSPASDTSVVGIGSSAIYFNNIFNRHWIASLFFVKYTAGFPNGQLPMVVNELIGAITAMKVLSLLAATRAQNTSTSLGIDAMSQSISTPGPQLYTVRLEELANQRKMLVKKLKHLLGTGFVIGDI